MEQGGSLVHADGGDLQKEVNLMVAVCSSIFGRWQWWGISLLGIKLILEWGIKLRRRGEEREGEAGEVERREEAVGSNCWTKFHAAF